MSPDDLKSRLREEAAKLGFEAVGFAPVPAELRREYYLKWIAEGCHGSMDWMERNCDRRLHPVNILPEAKSIVVLGLNYYQQHPESAYRVAKYALGKDYHDFLYKRLKSLCAVMRELGGEQKPYVDTGPVLEKPLAELAGMGWQGKSTILIHRPLGTWLFLGVVFTTLDLPPDAPAKNLCGACTRCLDACPTKAITGPYRLDARRCISYLTIEHDGPIPEEFHHAIGDRVYGCDTCLDVCPWNKWAALTREERLLARPLPALRDTLAWTPEEFTAHFAGSPVKRLKLHRWLRNALVVLGNTGDAVELPAVEALRTHADPMVAWHAERAAERIRSRRPAK